MAVALFCLALFLIILTGLPDLTDNEWRISAYVLDAVQNGHWFVQTDTVGQVASKPPLFTWLVSLAVLPTGEVTRFALYWPSAVATLVVALVLLYEGSRAFGWRAGHLAAATYLLSYVAVKQMGTARYEGLLTLAVTLGALAGFKAWQTGRGWMTFWLFAAAGTLVKGPVALLLMGSGLLAVFTFRGESRRLLGKGHIAGVAFYLALAGGWFALAYLQMGEPLVDKMLKRELLGHAIGGSEGRQWHEFLDPTWSFLRAYAPWSLLSVLAFWRIWKHPAANAQERSFERFLLAWIIVGLIVFSLASHQRGRLILPLIPAAALLGGRELSRWTVHVQSLLLFRWTAAAAAFFLAGVTVYSHVLVKFSHDVQETLAAQEIVARLRATGAGEFPFTYVDNLHPLQICYNTRRTMAPTEEAVALLRGDTPAFVVVTRTTLPLEDNLNGPIREVYRWPTQGKPRFRIVSNHPRLEWTENAALWLDGMQVVLTGARLQYGHADDLRLLSGPSGGQITVVNRGSTARDLAVRVKREGADDFLKHQHLPPNIPVEIPLRRN